MLGSIDNELAALGVGELSAPRHAARFVTRAQCILRDPDLLAGGGGFDVTDPLNKVCPASTIA